MPYYRIVTRRSCVRFLLKPGFISVCWTEECLPYLPNFRQQSIIAGCSLITPRLIRRGVQICERDPYPLAGMDPPRGLLELIWTGGSKSRGLNPLEHRPHLLLSLLPFVPLLCWRRSAQWLADEPRHRPDGDPTRRRGCQPRGGAVAPQEESHHG